MPQLRELPYGQCYSYTSGAGGVYRKLALTSALQEKVRSVLLDAIIRHDGFLIEDANTGWLGWEQPQTEVVAVCNGRYDGKDH